MTRILINAMPATTATAGPSRPRTLALPGRVGDPTFDAGEYDRARAGRYARRERFY